MHLLIVLAVGVLVFGRRLPEIGKSLGKGIVEFKKGLNGKAPLEDEVAEEEEAPRPVKRLQSGARLSASSPARAKNFSTNEEV